jgi:hypothetical protein
MQDRDENAPKRFFLFYTQMKIERKYEKKMKFYTIETKTKLFSTSGNVNETTFSSRTTREVKFLFLINKDYFRVVLHDPSSMPNLRYFKIPKIADIKSIFTDVRKNNQMGRTQHISKISRT